MIATLTKDSCNFYRGACPLCGAAQAFLCLPTEGFMKCYMCDIEGYLPHPRHVTFIEMFADRDPALFSHVLIIDVPSRKSFLPYRQLSPGGPNA